MSDPSRVSELETHLSQWKRRDRRRTAAAIAVPVVAAGLLGWWGEHRVGRAREPGRSRRLRRWISPMATRPRRSAASPRSGPSLRDCVRCRPRSRRRAARRGGWPASWTSAGSPQRRPKHAPPSSTRHSPRAAPCSSVEQQRDALAASAAGLQADVAAWRSGRPSCGRHWTRCRSRRPRPVGPRRGSGGRPAGRAGGASGRRDRRARRLAPARRQRWKARAPRRDRPPKRSGHSKRQRSIALRGDLAGATERLAEAEQTAAGLRTENERPRRRCGRPRRAPTALPTRPDAARDHRGQRR